MASAAWSATAAPPRRGRARRSGYSRSRRGATARCSSHSSCSVTPGRRSSRWIAAQSGCGRLILGRDRGRRVEPALQRLVRQVLRQRPAKAGAPRSPDALPGGRRADAQGSRRSCVWTCRRRTAAARRGSCAWVISVQACPAPSGKGAKPCQFADHPTAPVTPVHRLVAIARNGWSRSIGTPGRNQSE